MKKEKKEKKQEQQRHQQQCVGVQRQQPHRSVPLPISQDENQFTVSTERKNGKKRKMERTRHYSTAYKWQNPMPLMYFYRFSCDARANAVSQSDTDKHALCERMRATCTSWLRIMTAVLFRFWCASHITEHTQQG